MPDLRELASGVTSDETKRMPERAAHTTICPDPACQHANDAGAEFCARCGKVIAQAAPRSPGRKLIVVVVALVIVGGLAWPALHASRASHTRTISGATITALNVAQRTAEIEFVHPKSGLPQRARGTVASNCEIYIDGELAPGGLGDLRVGDTGSVSAIFAADRSITAQRVDVVRRAASQPAPTSQPAGALPRQTRPADHP